MVPSNLGCGSAVFAAMIILALSLAAGKRRKGVRKRRKLEEG
jgi:hypothetical protein